MGNWKISKNFHIFKDLDKKYAKISKQIWR